MSFRDPDANIVKTIAANRQNRDTYAVKMKYAQSVFVGIPLPSITNQKKFLIDVPRVDHRDKVIEAYIRDIEYLEKH
tara:strand:- start:61 stop:291 length:231 start_codon:yes stop_codon:yes gene_type:complete